MKAAVGSGAGLGLVLAAVVAAYLVFVGVPGGTAETERHISPAQEAAIEDGIASDVELREATGNLAECLRQSGVRVSDPTEGPQGSYVYEYLDGSPELDGLADRVEAVEGCYEHHLGDLERLRQQSPGYQTSATELGNGIQVCVEERKVGFQFTADASQLVRQVAELEMSGDPDFHACWSEVVGGALADAGVSHGSVGIAYKPLPR